MEYAPGGDWFIPGSAWPCQTLWPDLPYSFPPIDCCVRTNHSLLIGLTVSFIHWWYSVINILKHRAREVLGWGRWRMLVLPSRTRRDMSYSMSLNLINTFNTLNQTCLFLLLLYHANLGQALRLSEGMHKMWKHYSTSQLSSCRTSLYSGNSYTEIWYNKTPDITTKLFTPKDLAILSFHCSIIITWRGEWPHTRW